MNANPATTPHVRKTSPLSPEIFQLPLQSMPQVIAPRWMRLSMIWSVVLTVLIGILTLMSPMDEYVVAPGEVRPADYAFVFSRAGGILESIEVLDNQPVKRGQILPALMAGRSASSSRRSTARLPKPKRNSPWPKRRPAR